MKALKTVTALLLASAVGSNAFARECFKPDEIDAFKVDATMYGFGYMVGRCAKDFPSMKDDLFYQIRKLDKTYKPYTEQLSAKLDAAFEREYPGKRKENQQAFDIFVEGGIKKVWSPSPDGCKQLTAALGNYADLNDWDSFSRIIAVYQSNVEAMRPQIECKAGERP